jgi:microcystin degradation protein MlrC
MRIAVGQVSQETNTFNPLPTTRQDFEDFGVHRGAEVIAAMANTNEPGGFIQALRVWPEQPEIVGLVRLMAWPSGRATRETYQWLRSEMLGSLKSQASFDGVLLSLHGAMAADGESDVEGGILEAVRERLGPKVPVVATLDLHANITARMAACADALVLFHTAPHIDVFETGQRAAAVLRRILIEGVKPTMAVRKIPMVVPAERANTQDPAGVSHRLREELQHLEQQPGVLSAGLATVQPWLDIPELGSAVVVVTNNDRTLAEKECAALAGEVWKSRREYIPDLTPAAEAVREAFQKQSAGLVVLSDSADSTTSGAPGDSTWVLRELIKYSWPRPALVTLVAPEVVKEAQKLGVGAKRTGPLGGVRDARFSLPLHLAAEVANLFDARFVLSGHLGKNLPIDMGPSAVLRQGNVFIIVTSRSGPHFAPELFQAAGLDPFAASVLIAKSPCGFRAAYQDNAVQIMLVRAPGCAPADFWNYEYRKIPRPLWPWDDTVICGV